MAHDHRSRKEPAGVNRGLKKRCLDFVDHHPRVGWYVAILATANFILNLIDLWQ